MTVLTPSILYSSERDQDFSNDIPSTPKYIAERLSLCTCIATASYIRKFILIKSKGIQMLMLIFLVFPHDSDDNDDDDDGIAYL